MKLNESKVKDFMNKQFGKDSVNWNYSIEEDYTFFNNTTSYKEEVYINVFYNGYITSNIVVNAFNVVELLKK